MVQLQTSYAQKGIEIVEQYIDIPNVASRTVVEFSDIAEIGNYLPDDLTTLKRTAGNGARNVIQEVSLQEELDDLIADFSNNLAKALPNPEKALTLPFVAEAEDGSGIMLGDDMIIPYASIEGAVTVEVLNAIADGADIDELIQIVEREIRDFVGELESGPARGLYMNAGDKSGRWAGGKVNYRWGSLSAEHKTEVGEAMKDWKDSTGGKVYFSELSNTGWNNFQIGIHVIGVVNIFDYNFSGTKAGDSLVGYGGGERPLRIKTGLADLGLIRTSRHELGHALGLRHEHQRHDRDTYLDITEGGSDYEKIPEYLSGWQWNRICVRIGLLTISIPYLAYQEYKNSTAYDTFDFQSIMLYKDIHIKNTNQYTVWNWALSKTDIATVKSMY